MYYLKLTTATTRQSIINVARPRHFFLFLLQCGEEMSV